MLPLPLRSLGRWSLSVAPVIHSDQEQILVDLLTYVGVLGIGEGRLLQQASRWMLSGIWRPIRSFLRLKIMRCTNVISK